MTLEDVAHQSPAATRGDSIKFISMYAELWIPLFFCFFYKIIFVSSHHQFAIVSRCLVSEDATENKDVFDEPRGQRAEEVENAPFFCGISGRYSTDRQTDRKTASRLSALKFSRHLIPILEDVAYSLSPCSIPLPTVFSRTKSITTALRGYGISQA